MSSKLLVVGDSYCMNYVEMKNRVHIKHKEPYLLFDREQNKIREFEWKHLDEFKIWPEIVAEKINYDLINLSESGAGNLSIYSMALDYIISNKVDKAIIVWSGLGRWEFEALSLRLKKRLYKNGEAIGSFPTARLVPKNNTRSTWLRYHNHNLHKEFDKHNNLEFQTSELDNLSKAGVFSLETSVYNWFRLIYSMQEICKSLKIDLKMFQSVRPLKSVAENVEASKIIIKDPYLTKIDDKIFKGFPAINYIGGTCFSDIFREHETNCENSISEHDKHPNKNGHELIAEYVLND